VIDPRTRSAPSDRRGPSDLTLLACILAGLGLLLGMMSGVGLPVALAGTVLAAVAMRRRPADHPWPLVALLVGGVGTVIAAILLIIAVTVWLPELPRLLTG
jgi:hypothetical protein